MPVIDRAEAKEVILAGHYLHSFPSGWTYCFRHGDAVVVYSIPANKNLEPFLYREKVAMRELARLWAPTPHAPDLLTQAISASLKSLRKDVGTEAVVSFADPNNGHHGGIYQAASWIYTGKSSETRVYRKPDGTTVSRRSFHSGKTSLPPPWPAERLEGKHRYVRNLTRRAGHLLRLPSVPYPKPNL